ncbi:MAG TPA: DUF1501 domain-containing protein [Planctomycetia bacterium]|nr:DUF1501 domain-containing protein [Planctomycetia bacterium]
MNRTDFAHLQQSLARRAFVTDSLCGLGGMALSAMLAGEAAGAAPESKGRPGILAQPHFAAKAKRVIYLFMGGGPSHVDLLDPKPMLTKMHGQEMPKSVLGQQRVTLMTRNQGHFRAAATPYKFAKHGKSGQEFSELFKYTAELADDLAIVRSIQSEPINHDPAVTFMQTGRPQPGLPCMGSWLSYGLGAENADLPAFVVMLSGPFDQPIPSRYYHSGFLPAQHQGTQFQPGAEPVLYLNNPGGITPDNRGKLIAGINEMNRLKAAATGDREIEARIESYELAFRMQRSVPELMDLASESKATLDLYGPEAKTPGTFAYNCLVARRLAERGVRFVQLFHRGWDQHGNVTADLKRQCGATDQPAAALLKDLKSRGLLKDTLVIWGGEFGRTAYGQGDLKGGFGRDHHPRCFSMWMAGGGVKGGVTYGKTDEFGYNIVENAVPVHDLHATALHLLGIDHERLTYRFAGRNFRLTDVAGKRVDALLA